MTSRTEWQCQSWSSGHEPHPRTTAPARHLVEFFARYPCFKYNPKASVSAEFYRLIETYGWERDLKKAWAGFSSAMGKQFSTYYGSRVDDINTWQRLCVELKVNPVPQTIPKCKAVIDSTHVNLVDFIDTHITGKPIKKFATEKELRTYTKETGKIFPKESAKENGVLQYLLRKIFI
ncbi:hypothetical protein JOM56_014029 [Amanita muscaria]